MKNTNQAIKIYERNFLSPQGIHTRKILSRFISLISGFNEGYILADNIFLHKETNNNNDFSYTFYIIEPYYSSNTDKYLQLDKFLRKKIDDNIKEKIFLNLIEIITKLHSQNEAHLEINPHNIWIDDNYNIYLRSFKIDPLEINEYLNKICLNNKYQSWYRSPEEVFISGTILNLNENQLKKQDIWGLGCIFCEIFINFTPIFKTDQTDEKIIRFFEVLGFPYLNEIPFLTNEYYNELKNIYENNYNKKLFIMSKINENEKNIIRLLLNFNPDKRIELNSNYLNEELDFFFNNKLSKTKKELEINKNIIKINEKEKTKNIISKKSNKKLSFESEEIYSNENNSFDNSKNSFLNQIESDDNWDNIDPLITPKIDPFICINFDKEKKNDFSLNLKENKQEIINQQKGSE